MIGCQKDVHEINDEHKTEVRSENENFSKASPTRRIDIQFGSGPFCWIPAGICRIIIEWNNGEAIAKASANARLILVIPEDVLENAEHGDSIIDQYNSTGKFIMEEEFHIPTELVEELELNHSTIDPGVIANRA